MEHCLVQTLFDAFVYVLLQSFCMQAWVVGRSNESWDAICIVERSNDRCMAWGQLVWSLAFFQLTFDSK